jgi:hypothetical protein
MTYPSNTLALQAADATPVTANRLSKPDTDLFKSHRARGLRKKIAKRVARDQHADPMLESAIGIDEQV